MIDIFGSTNFDRSEFKCKGKKCDCGFDTVDAELLAVLQLVRENFEQPVIINSACRCEKHNDDIGGSIHSFHLIARAADIVVARTHPHEVYEFLDSVFPDQFGLGKYDTFTHIDTRTWRARW